VRTFTAYVEFDPETDLCVGIVPGIPGAHTQAATLDELQQNLKEVLELCLEENQPPRKGSGPPVASRDTARDRANA